MTDDQLPQSEIILYQTEDGGTGVEVRPQDGTAWPAQKLTAKLFSKDVRTVNEHIQNEFAEGSSPPIQLSGNSGSLPPTVSATKPSTTVWMSLFRWVTA